MEQIQFIGVSPETFTRDLLRNLKAEILQELIKPQEETYLTTKQVSEKFQVSTTTIQNWEAERLLKPYKFGRRKYYKLSEIEKEFKRINAKR